MKEETITIKVRKSAKKAADKALQLNETIVDFASDALKELAGKRKTKKK